MKHEYLNQFVLMMLSPVPPPLSRSSTFPSSCVPTTFWMALVAVGLKSPLVDAITDRPSGLCIAPRRRHQRSSVRSGGRRTVQKVPLLDRRPTLARIID